MTYLDVNEAGVRAMLARGIAGPVVMLNLLRFREAADYTADPDLAPPTPISGAAAYERYITHTTPYLDAAGGQVLFDGHGGAPLIGPADGAWDRILLVRHASVEAFLSFASNAEYLAGLGHRTAALEDSRLIPMVD